MDKENRLYEANRFPGNMGYQCFLLDRDNKVLLIGNPILNPIIWELYKQAISGENIGQKDIVDNTTIGVKETEIEMKGVKINKPSTAIFYINNTGDVPLFIQHISASCGCTTPEWEKRPINPGESTEVKIKVTPDNTGYPRKTVTVFCNTKKGSMPLVVKSVVKCS